MPPFIYERIMIKYLAVAFFTCGLVFKNSEVHAAPIDSVGTVVKNGKNFTVHKVAPKETFFGLARQYKVPMAQIQQANPGVTTLAVGQTVYVPGRVAAAPEVAVPATKPATSPATAPVTTSNPVAKTPVPAPVSESGSGVHTVQKSQTLLTIARQYNITMADIRKWNNLTSDKLQIGQTLVVAATNEPEANPTVTASIPAPVPAATETKTTAPPAAPKSANRPVVKPEITPAREISNEKVEKTETKYTESLSRVSESGLAELMDGKGENSKYLALHKTAPVGTILQVKNTQNNQSVYVRVAGKMPENTGNDKVIIRISKRAYQKLAAADNRFRVEVNYMP